MQKWKRMKTYGNGNEDVSLKALIKSHFAYYYLNISFYQLERLK